MHRFAWRPVAAATAVVWVLLAVVIDRYGFHRDELYFVAAGHHLAWGYDDQPPLTPLLVRAETAAFGDSVAAVRVLPLLLASALVPLTAAICREFGGTVRAQGAAAVAVAATPLVLLPGHLFATATLDVFFFAVLCLLVAVWLRTGADRLLLVMGAVAGVALLNNDLVAGLAAALLAGVVIAGPRRVLRSPWLYAAAAVAVAIWSPYLAWQSAHGWPELAMARAISGTGNRIEVLPFQVVIGAFTSGVWIAGLRALLRRPELAAFRSLAWAAVVLTGLVLVAGGKPYYPSGLLIPLYAAGGIAVADRAPRPVRQAADRAFALAVAVLVSLPVLPVRTFARSPLPKINDLTGETVGWPALVAQVAAVYRTVPGRPVILTENYGEAGAIDRFGARYGLPQAYAAHDGMIRWGPPHAPAAPVVVVGYDPADLGGLWRSVRTAATIDDGVHLDNQEQGAAILVAAAPTRSWPAIWTALSHHS